MAEKAHSTLEGEPSHKAGIDTGASSANDLAPSAVLRQAHWVAVGRLTPGLIHEFNNILCVIGNYIQLLLLNNEACSELSRRSGEVDLASPLQVINEHTERAQVLLHRFAEYARPLEEHPRSRLRVSDLLEDALTLVHLQRPLRKLHLHRERVEGVCEIEGDPNPVIDIFIELLTIAAHAIPCGGTLTISTRSIPSTGLRTGFGTPTSVTTGSSAGPAPGKVVISFTGVGQWPHISDRGLEFVRTLVEQLGGRLVCESGRDATYRVSTAGRIRLDSGQDSTGFRAGIWVALPQHTPLSPSPATPYLRGNQYGEVDESSRYCQ